MSTVDGVTGVNDIYNMGLQHYRSLLNSSNDTSCKDYGMKHVSVLIMVCLFVNGLLLMMSKNP